MQAAPSAVEFASECGVRETERASEPAARAVPEGSATRCPPMTPKLSEKSGRGGGSAMASSCRSRQTWAN
eukprot:5787775-Pleurochrysis_carterae.AAC.1